MKKVLALLLSLVLFFTSCASVGNFVDKSEILPKVKKSEYLLYKLKDGELGKLIVQVSTSVSKKKFTEVDNQALGKIVQVYKEYQILKNSSVAIPPGSSIEIPVKIYCLASGKAAPTAEENFRWIKKPVDIPYFKDIVSLESKSIISQDKSQHLIWNLENGAPWEEYSTEDKEIFKKIDPNIQKTLPSKLKNKIKEKVADLVFEYRDNGVLDAYSLLRGYYYEAKKYRKEIENLKSSYTIVNINKLYEIPSSGVYVEHFSSGYSSQNITFYNPSNIETKIYLNEYFLEATRPDVQPIGFGLINTGGIAAGTLSRIPPFLLALIAAGVLIGLNPELLDEIRDLFNMPKTQAESEESSDKDTSKNNSKSPQTPTGQRGAPLNVKPGTNKPEIINGRKYSGHSLDKMQGRGIPPSAVEEVIKSGSKSQGNKPGTKIHKFQDLKVITNSNGDVITVIPK